MHFDKYNGFKKLHEIKTPGVEDNTKLFALDDDYKMCDHNDALL